MSLAVDGRHILCDGEGCDATSGIPVALNAILGTTVAVAQGWLHILRQSTAFHFCPECAPQYLEKHPHDREPCAVRIETNPRTKESLRELVEGENYVRAIEISSK